MTRTITALFDHRHDAEAAEARLKAANIDADHIRIHDRSSAGYSETDGSTHDAPGLWASIRNAFLPDDDRHIYEEGMRRGGVLLTADVDGDAVDEAVRVLEAADTVDIDDRAQQWRSSGWAGATADDAGLIAGSVAADRFVMGRRESGRGGNRLRSYVTEAPLHEQVRLRDGRGDTAPDGDAPFGGGDRR